MNNVLRPERLVARTALGIKELQDFLQCFGIGRVAKKRAFAANLDQSFVPEFVEMMGQCRIWDIQFLLDLSDDHPLRVSRQEQLHDAESGFRTHRRKHLGVSRDLLRRSLGLGLYHISMLAEI
jgi:hypothetical protein